MSQLSGAFTVEVDITRLAQLVAAHILDAFNAAEFGDQLAAKVAELVTAQQGGDRPEPGAAPGPAGGTGEPEPGR